MRFLSRVLLAFVVLAPASLYAGNFGRSRCYSNGCYYSDPCYQRDVVFAPIYAPEGYYRVGDEYKMKNLIAAVVQELQTPQVSYEAPQVKYSQPVQYRSTDPAPAPAAAPVQGGYSNCNNGYCRPTALPAQPPAAQPPANKPAPTQGGATAPPEVERDVLAVFTNTSAGQKSCVQCHGATDKLSGNLRLVWKQPDGSFKLANLDKPKRTLVHFKAEKGEMPPSVLEDPANTKDAHAVTNDGMKALEAWVSYAK